MKPIQMWILLVVPMLSSCATRYGPVGRHADAVDSAPRQTVYVVNPDLDPEMAILEESGIYELTSDPAHSFRLTLNNMKYVHRAEGMPYLISVFTLGLVPVSFHDATRFSYSIAGPEGVTEHEYIVFVEERYSLWERFRGAPAMSEQQALAKGLALAVHSGSVPADDGLPPGY